MKIKTAIEYFYDWEANDPNRLFLRQPYGNEWYTLTYRQAGEQARKMAAALQSLGLQQGDHIGIYSKNCYHWIITDLAIMMGGFVSVPFYASLPPEQLEEVVIKSDIKIIFAGKLDKWEGHAKAIPENVQIIRYPHYNGNAAVSEGLLWDDLIHEHQPVSTHYIPELDATWSILYTSGTTGSPKGAMLPHSSPATVIHDESQNHELGIASLNNVQLLSFLPLNHVGERIGLEMLCLLMGGTISFVENINTFAQNLRDTRPTFFFAVPRIWIKMQKGIFERIPEKVLNTLFAIPILSGFIKKTLREKLGFGRLEITLTGAAITPTHVKEWYRKLGINLREVYGMTECCGSATLTPVGEFSADNVGKPLKGFELRIDPKTGEVQYRSSQQMTGYYKEPERTAEVIKDGWIHSGDKGSLDKNGNLKIEGRIKDAFKTAKGLYITPNKMEEELTKSPLIEQVCVVGLGLDQPLALVNLSDTAKSMAKPEIEQSLTSALQKVNDSLNNFEKISTIIITKEIWSDQNMLLTPTLKTRRPKIDEKYSNCYPLWQDNKACVVWEE
jgi:long-chain acyl-CoA synthetase